MSKKGYIVVFVLVLIICISSTLMFVFFRDAFYSTKYQISSQSYSTKYYEISPLGESSTKVWRQGMVSGNGVQGVITSSSPYEDTFIYQNIHFIMPTGTPRENISTYNELESVRQAIVNKSSYQDNQPYLHLSCYHPGAQLRLSQKRNILKDYIRYTNYETAEVVTKYKDYNGDWERKTFTSQSDGVTITKYSSLSNSKISVDISIDDISKLPNFGKKGDWEEGEVNMQYKKIVADDAKYIAQIAHYPDDENSDIRDAGYATMVYVIVEGGEKEVDLGRKASEKQNVGYYANPTIKVNNADKVYLLAVSERDLAMGKMSDFAQAESYSLLEELDSQISSVVEKYTENGIFNYDKALERHAEIFTPMFESVKVEFDVLESDRYLSNEQLIEKQKRSKVINQALAERAYYSGRYAMLCCSGTSTSRLYGMWTGEWNGGWGAKYTMDANVNLQTSSLNSSNIEIAPIGYANFILRQVDDWEDNAKATHNFTNCIQAPVNFDGDNALMIESCYPYPFRYWNAGASWLLEPLYETWQTYGNIQIPISDEYNLYDIKSVLSTTDVPLEDAYIESLIDRGFLYLEQDVLLPLLIKSANYWDQLCDPRYYTDENGAIHYDANKTALLDSEKYCIIPSYSPENQPKNYDSPSAANSAIDIGAFNSNIDMLCDIMLDINPSSDVSYWRALQDKIPQYIYDETNALKEWATISLEENNEHRHISHLYCAWPLDETQHNEKLRQGAIQAILNRASENAASHALVHRSLICDRLKDKEGLELALRSLMSSKIYYTSLLTNHHTTATSAYCTDFAIGYTGIINESLMYSNTHELEVLPTKISYFEKGSIKGLAARCGAYVSIKWDKDKIEVEIQAIKDTYFDLSCGEKYSSVQYEDCSSLSINLVKGQSVKVTFTK